MMLQYLDVAEASVQCGPGADPAGASRSVHQLHNFRRAAGRMGHGKQQVRDPVGSGNAFNLGSEGIESVGAMSVGVISAVGKGRVATRTGVLGWASVSTASVGSKAGSVGAMSPGGMGRVSKFAWEADVEFVAAADAGAEVGAAAVALTGTDAGVNVGG